MGVLYIKPPVLSASVNIASRHHPHHCRVLKIGRKDDKIFRVLLRFRLSDLPRTLSVYSATLYLFSPDDFPASPQTIQLYQVLSRWTRRKLSGDHFPLTKTRPLDSIQINKRSENVVAFNLTPLVKKWQNNQAANLGLMIKTEDETLDSLIGFCSNKYRDSSRWPYIEINYQKDIPLESSLERHCHRLDLHSHVRTSDEKRCTNPINTLNANYTYLVTNNGHSPANAYLQISPDGEDWLTQSEIATILPRQVHAFVANVIAKYSRLCYSSAAPGKSTCLTVYIQGIS